MGCAGPSGPRQRRRLATVDPTLRRRKQATTSFGEEAEGRLHPMVALRTLRLGRKVSLAELGATAKPSHEGLVRLSQYPWRRGSVVAARLLRSLLLIFC